MKGHENRTPLLQQIGNTPLVELTLPELQTPKGATVLGKLEYLNPGGSIKDRSALFMIEDAESRGVLKPGGTIVEASSGNQGIAIAMIGAIKGYRVIITVPKHTSKEKVATLRAYGAEVHICPDTATLSDPRSYHSVATRLKGEIEDVFMPNQYFNICNPRAHYERTGPELFKQIGDRITHFFCGMGSCGTISGVGRFLKEQRPDIQVIGIDSDKSLLSAKEPAPYETEGIGVDVISDTLNREVIDEIVPVSDEQAFGTARKLAARGILVGPSSGAVMSVILSRAPSFSPKDCIVCILADSGRAYLSKVFAEEAFGSSSEHHGNTDKIAVGMA
ncbi:MAG: cysteine synthase family protein [Bdellovibrionales bacterium]|nr:cysteine synthase family protein [Bdellovibrionales bacterium]